MDTATNSLPMIAMMPSPGIGHLIPLVEFAKRLVDGHRFSVTFLVPTDGSLLGSQTELLQALPDTIFHVFLPPVSLNDRPDNLGAEIRIILTVNRSLPDLRNSLKQLALSNLLVALVVDLFGGFALEIASELSLLPYIFFPSNALALSLIYNLPNLPEACPCMHGDVPEPVQLPGCIPLHAVDLVDQIRNRKSEAYNWFLELGKKYGSASGMFVNSFVDLEPETFKALMDGNDMDGHAYPPIYPIGPIIQSVNSRIHPEEHLWFEWLDSQPEDSVLFVSFGSGGTLSLDQQMELALGLEMSGQRFLWVAKNPHESLSNASYFGSQININPLESLPEGFLHRTENVGRVVPFWAPQIKVLSHGSTGGFLSHCGWNSILESIVHGVPFIAWPLYAEQRMNAALMTDALKVAVRVQPDQNGMVGREEIASHVKDIFHGDRGKLAREQIKALKDKALMALGRDGSSTKFINEVAEIWKKKIHN